ncbi:MAG: hypothetical protein ACLVAV_06230 [Clostridium sp.]
MVRKYAARSHPLHRPEMPYHSGAGTIKSRIEKRDFNQAEEFGTAPVPLSGNSNEFQFADPVKKDGTPERFRTCPAP